MSLDEARSGFQVDALPNTGTSNYLLVGDNAYGYTYAASSAYLSYIGDVDVYLMELDYGSSYSLVTGSAAPLYSPGPYNSNFALLNRYGTILAFSTDYGSYSGLSFTATDTRYYVAEYSDSLGYYSIRLANNTITEQNGLGETIIPGHVYSARIDYSSDVDIYDFYAQAGHVYFVKLTTQVQDLYLDVEYMDLRVDNLVATGSGAYYFTAGATGAYSLHLSSNSFHQIGNYSFVAGEIVAALVAATPGSRAEGSSGSTGFTFTVSLAQPVTSAQSVGWSVVGSGAHPADAADFAGGVLPSGTLTFTAGEASKVVTVNVAADALVEPDEGFSLVLGSPSVGLMLGSATAAATILNDDVSLPLLTGTAGNDALVGTNGVDTLNGGPGGQDTLTGGAGADRFEVMAGTAAITDLGAGGADTLVVAGGATATATLAAAWTATAESANAGTASLVAAGFGVNLAAASGPQGWWVSNADSPAAVMLTGSAHGDHLGGGSGNDTLDGSGGNDTLAGDLGNDTYLLDSAGDVVVEAASAGTDTVLLGTAVASYTLPANVEHAVAANGAAHLVFGNLLNNALTGGDSNDTLVGLGGHDTLLGGSGDDVIYAHAGDRIDGGAGRDVLYMVDDTPTSLAIDAAQIEFVAAGFGNDTINGAGQTRAIEVYASGGDDSVVGGSGNDWLWGSVGNDTLIGNAGDDVIVGDLGADSLSGGAGNDRMYVDAQDTIDGGDGFDAAYIIGGTGMAINLATTHMEWVTDFVAGNDTLDASGTTTGVELYAGGGNDLLTGGSGADLIFAGEGADTLIGGDGDDGLIGEGGADSISGGAGNDRIYADTTDTVDGGDGYDIMYMVTDAAFTVDLGAIHVEWLFAGAGNDSVTSSTATPIQVYANGGNDTLSGGGGNDTLWGGDGDDSIAGNAGSDTLVGGAGADTLAGGAGDDGLFGGDGADVFVLGTGWGNDTIFDWQDGSDLIDVRALAASGLHAFGGFGLIASGGNAVLSYAGNMLTLLGAAGKIDAADFLFA